MQLFEQLINMLKERSMNKITPIGMDTVLICIQAN